MACNDRNMSSVIDIRGACVALDHTTILDQVSVTAHSGEVLALIGPNGAGKTTLLKAISGDIPLTSGNISFAQQALDEWNNIDRARAMAVLPQLSLLNFPYSVEEVVSLGRTPHKTGVTIDQNIVQEAMHAMDITHLKERPYTHLSGGEKQRTQLARVLTQIWRKEDASPRLLLLDEPTTALDLGHQQLLMKAISTFAKTGVAVIMVVHDVNIAAAYADRVLALKDGRVLADGNTDEVIDAALVASLFGAKVNLLTHPETGKRMIIP